MKYSAYWSYTQDPDHFIPFYTYQYCIEVNSKWWSERQIKRGLSLGPESHWFRKAYEEEINAEIEMVLYKMEVQSQPTSHWNLETKMICELNWFYNTTLFDWASHVFSSQLIANGE